MKLKNSDFARGLPAGIERLAIFFFCGPDEAGASAAANRLAAALPDAGERVELTGADLRRDPALLGDEARSTSLFGGRRHIFVRASGDEAHDALQVLIETGEALRTGSQSPLFQPVRRPRWVIWIITLQSCAWQASASSRSQVTMSSR